MSDKKTCGVVCRVSGRSGARLGRGVTAKGQMCTSYGGCESQPPLWTISGGCEYQPPLSDPSGVVAVTHGRHFGPEWRLCASEKKIAMRTISRQNRPVLTAATLLGRRVAAVSDGLHFGPKWRP